MNEVWVIEAGDYSNYRVLAVCASEAEAKAVCERANRLIGDDGYEHWECSGRTFATVEDVVVLWARNFNLRGEPITPDCFGTPGYASVGLVADEGVEFGNDRWFHVNARTSERALKIAQDYAAQRKAEEAGMT